MERSPVALRIVFHHKEENTLSEEASLQRIDSESFAPSATSPLPNSSHLPDGIFGAPEPPHSSLWSQILIGPSGLRAGWGLLLFIALFFSLAAGIGFVSHKIHPPAKPATQVVKVGGVVEQKVKSSLIGESVSFAIVAIATWIMSRVERRPVGAYGFGGTRKIGPFLAGLAWGVAFLSALVGVLWKTGLLTFDTRLLFGASALRYGAIWAVGFVLVGLFEEYLLRGYLQFTLSRGLASLYNMLFDTIHGEALGFWTAALILSFLFGLVHETNPGESPIGLLSAGLIGVVFCLTLWRTGSLWWAVGFHAAWDWAQSVLFGVADSGTMVQGHLFATHPLGKVMLSGGATGPEGSIFILPLLVVLTLVILWTVPARRTTA